VVLLESFGVVCIPAPLEVKQVDHVDELVLLFAVQINNVGDPIQDLLVVALNDNLLYLGELQNHGYQSRYISLGLLRNFQTIAHAVEGNVDEVNVHQQVLALLVGEYYHERFYEGISQVNFYTFYLVKRIRLFQIWS